MATLQQLVNTNGEVSNMPGIVDRSPPVAGASSLSRTTGWGWRISLENWSLSMPTNNDMLQFVALLILLALLIQLLILGE